MTKKILSVLLVLVLAFSLMPLTGAYADSFDKTEAQNATAFVESVAGTVSVAKANTNRAEFIGAMAQLFNLDVSNVSEQFFADVPPSHTNNTAIITACKLGWISNGEAFRPTNEITYAEAMKIAEIFWSTLPI